MNKVILSAVLSVAGSPAFAKGNGSSDEILGAIAGVLIMLITAFIVEASKQPHDKKGEILSEVPAGEIFDLHFYNQSGNHRDSCVAYSWEQVVATINSRFNRSSIKQNYNIYKRKDGRIDFARVHHNGRGRQEGKVLGGCIVVPRIQES